MAQVISLTTYEVNGIPTSATTRMFPAASQAQPYTGNNPALYSIIFGAPNNSFTYAVVQTVAQIVALANA
jgi:hypothetical protein